MAWNVLLPQKMDRTGLSQIDDFSTFSRVGDDYTVAEVYQHIQEFDAVILRGDLEFDSETIEDASNLKVITKYGIGLDNVDISAATKHDIVVCNAPGSNSNAVAEHVFCLVLSLRRKIIQADERTRGGDWEKVSGTFREAFKSTELRNRAIGLYGCGNIGERVAKIASGFGMDCYGYDPYVREYNLYSPIQLVDSKEELLARSDVFSVHAPLTEETRHAIGEAELDELPEGAVLINTARGEIVEEDALVTALQNGTIDGAGLDVFYDEPLQEEHPLTELDNVVVTPHMAGATRESDREKSHRSAQNISEVYHGRVPDSAVNWRGLVSTDSAV